MNANYARFAEAEVRNKIAFNAHEGYDYSFDFASSQSQRAVRKHLLQFLIPGFIGFGLLNLGFLLPWILVELQLVASYFILDLLTVALPIFASLLMYMFAYNGAGILYWQKKQGKTGGYKAAARLLMEKFWANLSLSGMLTGLGIGGYLLVTMFISAFYTEGDLENDQTLNKIAGIAVVVCLVLFFLLHGFWQFAGCLVNLAGYGSRTALKVSWRLTKSTPRRALTFGLYNLILLLLNGFTCSLLFPYLSSLAGATTYAAFYEIAGFEADAGTPLVHAENED